MGELLLERGVLDNDQLAIAVVERSGLQHASLDTLDPDLAGIHLVPAGALPLIHARGPRCPARPPDRLEDKSATASALEDAGATVPAEEPALNASA